MAISYSISYTFSPSTTISSSQANQNFSDNANTWNGIEAKTKTFSNLGVDTELKTGGTLSTANGTVAAPSLTFTNSTGSGLYRIGADNIAIAAAGVKALEVRTDASVTIRGITTSTAAATGFVAEILSASSTYGSPVSLTSGATANLTSLPLTAGDWDVYCQGALKSTAAGTNVGAVFMALSTTSVTMPNTVFVQDANGQIESDSYFATIVPGNGGTIIASPLFSYVRIAATTTYYLTMNCTFTVSTASGFGSIVARRRA